MAELPSPPFVDVPGIANFRDIGGQPTTNGRFVRRGIVFRSADPSRPTEAGMQKMQELGIKVIFDLRSAPEIRRDGPEWSDIPVDEHNAFEPYGIRKEWVPVFPEKDYSPEQIALRYKDYTRGTSEGFVAAYYDILLSAPFAYGKIFRHLASEHPTPCIVNCTAGKDRTGVAIALILSLAGVSAAHTADEYSLTDIGLAEAKPVLIERLLRNPILNGNSAGVVNMVGSKRENMEAAIKMIDEKFGGAVEYVKKYCGLSVEEVERIKRNIVVDEDRS